MKRPLVYMALLLFAVAIIGSAFSFNLIIMLVTALVVTFFTFIFLKKAIKSKLFTLFSFFVLFLSIIISINSKTPIFVESLERSKADKEVFLTGQIYQYKEGEKGCFLLKNASLISNNKRYFIKSVLLRGDIKDISLGDRFEGEVTIKALEERRNIGNFDERSYYKSIGIFSKAYIKNEGKSRIYSSQNPIYIFAGAFREKLANSLATISPLYQGQIKSIILGDQTFLESDIKDLYREAGIGHILAISGLHVSFVGIAIYKRLRARVGNILLSSSLAAFILFSYCLITGFSLSSIRAMSMFFIMLFADVIYKSYEPFSSLSTVFIVNLLSNGNIIKGQSFYLSYGAVLSIYLSTYCLKKICFQRERYKINFLFQSLISSVFLYIFLLPINIYFFYEISLYSILINLIVIPLASILMAFSLSAALLGIFLRKIAYIIVGVSEEILAIYIYLSQLTLKLPFSRILIGGISIWQVVFYYFLLFLILFIFLKIQKQVLFKSILIALIFSLSLLFLFKKNNESFFLSMIDVGQGDAFLIHTDNDKYIFMDAGSSDIKDVYKYRISSHLQNLSINSIDYFCLSHMDKDHISALIEILDNYDNKKLSIKKLLLPKMKNKDKDYIYIENKAYQAGIDIVYVEEGYIIFNEAFKLELLELDKESTSKSKNDNSAIYKYSDKDTSILFTGDISKELEKKIINKAKSFQADILKVSHHGSNTATSEEFLDFINPKLALISAGVNNMYGHPHKEVIKRLEKRNIKVFVTANSGAFILRKDREGLFSLKK